MHERGHFYVCGDVSMAEDVCKTLKFILKENGTDDPDIALVSLKVCQLYIFYGQLYDSGVFDLAILVQENMRYHEDIFGVTLRMSEVTNKRRSDALTKRSFSNS